MLDGATELLSSRSVRYVEFEVHNDLRGSTWGRTRLSDVTRRLESFGYDCYWMGRAGQLTRLSGCHHKEFDGPLSWSNVACVQRADIWHSAVASFSRGGLCEAWGKAPDVFALEGTDDRLIGQMYWHSTIGVIVPLLAAMHDSCTCGCAPTIALPPSFFNPREPFAQPAQRPREGRHPPKRGACLPATLRMRFKPIGALEAQLRELLPKLRVDVVRSGEKLTQLGDPVTIFTRGDHLNLDSSLPSLWKARRMLSSFCGLPSLDTTRGDRTSDSNARINGSGTPNRYDRHHRRALIISRCDASPTLLKAAVNIPHRRMCINGSEEHGHVGEIRSVLRRYGYTTSTAFPERLSMCEQLRATATADIIIYGHGSSQANLLSVSSFTVAVELMPYEYLANPARGLDRCLECARPDHSSYNPLCLAQQPHATEIAHRREHMRPAQPFPRNQSAALVAALKIAGLKLKHITVPVAPHSAWSCVPARTLAELAVWSHKLLLEGEVQRRAYWTSMALRRSPPPRAKPSQPRWSSHSKRPAHVHVSPLSPLRLYSKLSLFLSCGWPHGICGLLHMQGVDGMHVLLVVGAVVCVCAGAYWRVRRRSD